VCPFQYTPSQYFLPNPSSCLSIVPSHPLSTLFPLTTASFHSRPTLFPHTLFPPSSRPLVPPSPQPSAAILGCMHEHFLTSSGRVEVVYLWCELSTCLPLLQATVDAVVISTLRRVSFSTGSSFSPWISMSEYIWPISKLSSWRSAGFCARQVEA